MISPDPMLGKYVSACNLWVCAQAMINNEVTVADSLDYNPCPGSLSLQHPCEYSMSERFLLGECLCEPSTSLSALSALSQPAQQPLCTH